MLEKFMLMSFMIVGDLKARRNEKGATATEYGLLVAFIAMAIVLAVTAFGTELDAFFDALAAEVGTWVVP